MMEMVVLAVTLVLAQTVAGIIMMKVFMSKAYIKKIAKMSVELTNELMTEVYCDEEDEVQ